MSLPLPHDAHVLPAVVCGVCQRTISIEQDAEAAALLASEHNAEHEPRHSCQWDEHAGYVGKEHCPGCVAERLLGIGYQARRAS